MNRKSVKPKYQRKPQVQADNKLGALAGNANFQKHLSWILVAVLFLLLALLYFPIAFGKQTPIATDITQWQGAAQSIIEYNNTHSDRALWTQSMFSGMPAYMISFPNRIPFLESVINFLGRIMNWRIFLLFMGGLGVFLLLRQWKLDPYICFIGAIAFVFSCHWVGLLEIGHNTKFRAMMYVPWVLWALFYLRKKPGLLGLGLLASTLIVQLRENHPQITYYLYLFIGMYWIWELIQSIVKKEHKDFWLFTLLAALAFGLTALAVMNPYLSTMEYSHYTMRGGSSGLDTAYAQGWSFHPLEILSFIVPDAFGGINQTYWGFMPFTQVYNYYGIVVLALGIIALTTPKNRKTATFLWITSAIFTIMSFGSFAPAISDLFLKYLPFFNKFRVPSMILVMVQLNAVLLAALGLDTLLDKVGDAKYGKLLLGLFWISGAIFVLWLSLGKTVFGGLSFTSERELSQLAQHGLTELPDHMRLERLDLLYKSGILSFLFLTVSLGIAYLHNIKKLPKTAFMLLIAGIIFVDLWVYTGKHLKDLYPEQDYHGKFAALDYDDFLMQDKSNYRVYPITQNAFTEDRLPKPTGEYAYYHQIITGYSAAKLQRYENIMKLIDGDAATQRPGQWLRYLINLSQSAQTGELKETPMPVLNMLNAKYFLIPDQIPADDVLTHIKPVFTSQEGLTVYENTQVLPRAWFVDKAIHIADADSTLGLMAREDFDPAHIAYVEEPIAGIAAPDSAWVKQTKSEMHTLEYELYTDKDALLVSSEVYYPAGWKAYLDGKEIPIYVANHALRSFKIPAGSHKLELSFKPESYSKSVKLSLAGILGTTLILIAGLALQLSRKRKSLDEQVIHQQDNN